MAQIDGAGQQDTDDQNAETLQAALAQRQVTLQGQPQSGRDVPLHQNSDPVSDESEILRSCQPLTGKRRVPCSPPAFLAYASDLSAHLSFPSRCQPPNYPTFQTGLSWTGLHGVGRQFRPAPSYHVRCSLIPGSLPAPVEGPPCCFSSSPCAASRAPLRPGSLTHSSHPSLRTSLHR